MRKEKLGLREKVSDQWQEAERPRREETKKRNEANQKGVFSADNGQKSEHREGEREEIIGEQPKRADQKKKREGQNDHTLQMKTETEERRKTKLCTVAQTWPQSKPSCVRC